MLVSCKKKSDNQGENSSTGYRIIQEKNYYNNLLEDRTDFSYSGNNLTEIFGYTQGTKAGPDGKITLEYEGGNISRVSVFANISGAWSIMEEALAVSYTGSLPAERIITTYDDTGSVTNQVRYTDTYLNGQVNEEKSYSMQDGSWVLEYRDQYIYNAQGQLQNIRSYFGSGDQRAAVTYLWQNNLIVEEQSSNTDSSLLHKVEYSYSGTSLTGEVRSVFIDNSWTQTGTTSYVYDTQGNLSSQTDRYTTPSDVFRLDFTYEAGKGNFRQLYVVMGAAPLWNGAPFPMPTKSSGLPDGQLRDVFHRNR